MFDAKLIKDEIVKWIKDWFDINGKDCKAVVGISGGKDSTIVAALCVEALGKDKVIGVLMPNHYGWKDAPDIDIAEGVVKHLGIKQINVNIYEVVNSLYKVLPFSMSEQSRINMPPRIRMTTLYAVAQSHNGRVANTCNLSEDWIGYSTRYGDSVGDFSPISRLTVTEVKAIGYELGLPKELIEKVPTDGLCGKTDEDNFGFTYEVLDNYIRTGICEDKNIKEKIDDMHNKNLFKLQLMPCYELVAERLSSSHEEII